MNLQASDSDYFSYIPVPFQEKTLPNESFDRVLITDY